MNQIAVTDGNGVWYVDDWRELWRLTWGAMALALHLEANGGLVQAADAVSRSAPTACTSAIYLAYEEPMTQHLIERIPPHQDVDSDKPVYWEPDIRATATTVIDLPDGMLAVDHDDDLHVSVVLFAYSGGPAYMDGVEVEPRSYQRIMYGDGPSGSLRELRHTFWGEQDNGGYVFYPNAALICGAFEALKRWFDCD